MFEEEEGGGSARRKRRRRRRKWKKRRRRRRSPYRVTGEELILDEFIRTESARERERERGGRQMDKTISINHGASHGAISSDFNKM